MGLSPSSSHGNGGSQPEAPLTLTGTDPNVAQFIVQSAPDQVEPMFKLKNSDGSDVVYLSENVGLTIDTSFVAGDDDGLTINLSEDPAYGLRVGRADFGIFFTLDAHGALALTLVDSNGYFGVTDDDTGNGITVQASGTTIDGQVADGSVFRVRAFPNILFEASGSGLGFYGTAPIAKPTGVAVSAAGIHAALVSLGLIAA